MYKHYFVSVEKCTVLPVCLGWTKPSCIFDFVIDSRCNIHAPDLKLCRITAPQREIKLKTNFIEIRRNNQHGIVGLSLLSFS